MLLYLDASLGDKSDRETVYNRVVSSVPVDIAKLYQNLVDWRLSRERLSRLNFSWLDPSIQSRALLGCVQKLRDKEPQFCFELRSFCAARNGGGNGMNTQETVDDMLTLMITDAHQHQHHSASGPPSGTPQAGSKPLVRDGKKPEARSSTSTENKKVCWPSTTIGPQ